MKVIHEGKAHKAKAWFTTCDTCNSELRIIEGDPMAGGTCYNCDARQYYIRYICPVCGRKKIAYTNSSFGLEGNAKYKEIVLEKEDREEIENFDKIREDMMKNGIDKSVEDHLRNRSRY